MLSIVVFLISVSRLESQAKFVKPDKAIDLSKYETYDKCISLQRRLNGREERHLPYWKDSLEYVKSPKLSEYSKTVRDTVAICMSKFTPANVNYDNHTEYLDWITVFYDVGRDADAEAVINRILSISNKDTALSVESERSVIITLVNALERVRPLPWDMIVRLAKMVDSQEYQISWQDKIYIYAFLLRLSGEINDTIISEYAAEMAVQLEKRMSAEDKSGYEWQSQGRFAVLDAMDFLNNKEMLDSLRSGPESYLLYRNSYWAKIRGQNTDKLPDHVGEIAKPIAADFWFNSDGDSLYRFSQASQSIPERGTVNLIVFLEIRCSRNTPMFRSSYHRSFPVSGPCFPMYSSIRRLALRYPSLKVTIVSHTDGYIGLTDPLTPEQEAILKSQWWLGTHRIPATLAVAEQKFFRLSEPDGRRIDEPHDNFINYQFGIPERRIPSGKAFLIDIDGHVLYSAEINPTNERRFDQLLQATARRSR